jgi:hypothetical protein
MRFGHVVVHMVTMNEIEFQLFIVIFKPIF